MVRRDGVAPMGGRLLVDPFDVGLQDDVLLAEVELTTNLIVAANQADRSLSLAEIDEILGVHGASLPDQREPTEDRD